MRLLLIDNYDSFTYNLLHLFAQIDEVTIDVVRNDNIPFQEIKNGVYQGAIIGPGPGDPADQKYFGQNSGLISDFGTKGLPILGVCLGFQGIATIFGAKLKKAKIPQHGKKSTLKILEPTGMFESISSGVEVMRYHSLMIDQELAGVDNLIITAEVDTSSETVKANGREIMAICHTNYPIHGVQFHPESFATDLGNVMAKNFVNIIKNDN